MCDPTSLAIASVAVSTIGTVVSTVDQYQQQQVSAKNQRKQLRYQEAQAKEQAKARMNEAKAEAKAVRREAARRQGRLRALAARGGGMSGSMLDAMASEAKEYELSAMNRMYQGESASQGHLDDAAISKYQSKLVSAPTLNPFDFAKPVASIAGQLSGLAGETKLTDGGGGGIAKPNGGS